MKQSSAGSKIPIDGVSSTLIPKHDHNDSGRANCRFSRTLKIKVLVVINLVVLIRDTNHLI